MFSARHIFFVEFASSTDSHIVSFSCYWDYIMDYTIFPNWKNFEMLSSDILVSVRAVSENEEHYTQMFQNLWHQLERDGDTNQAVRQKNRAIAI